MNDRVVSWIRTAIPGLWATLISYLATRFAFPDEVVDWLGGPATVAVVVWLVLALWYALWRWLEPRMPDLLTRLVLGSARAPRYDLTANQRSDGTFEVNAPTTAASDILAAAEERRRRQPPGSFPL